MHSKKPNVSNLKVFGFKAYVHVHEEKRKGKLQKKSKPCIFVGYPVNENEYNSYDLETRKMIRSCDIIFVEDAFNIKIINEPDQKKFFGSA